MATLKKAEIGPVETAAYPPPTSSLVGYLANAVDAPKTSDRFFTLTLVPVAGMKLRAKSSRARSPAALTSLSRPFLSSERYNFRSYAGIVTGVSSFRSCGKDRSEIARKAPDQERREQSPFRNDHLAGSQIEISSNAKPKPAQGPSNQSSSDEDTPMPDTTIYDVEYFNIPSTPPTESDYNGDGSDHDPDPESNDDFYGHTESERRRIQNRYSMDGHWKGSGAAKDSEDDGRLVGQPLYDWLGDSLELSPESVDRVPFPIYERRNCGGLWQDWGLTRQKGFKPGNGKLS